MGHDPEKIKPMAEPTATRMTPVSMSLRMELESASAE